MSATQPAPTPGPTPGPTPRAVPGPAAGPQRYDAVLIGGGIMSATLAALLTEVQPDWSVVVLEKLSALGQESSAPWHNAGTGHAALCELNYTPARSDGGVEISKAVSVNESWQVSRQFWAHLVESGAIPDPTRFINPVPHMSFVRGDANTAYLRARYDALSDHPLFRGMEWSTERGRIGEWAPLLTDGRDPSERIAATRSAAGTDVDFGELTRALLGLAQQRGVQVHTGRTVKDVKRSGTGWEVSVREAGGGSATLRAPFVFVGSGGGALHLLQRSGIPEGRGFGGFPVSGQFLRCRRPEVAQRHSAKVYGQAEVGAPPMSVPHLDTRIVAGERALLFGPYAGFSPRFLKQGALTDLPFSIRPDNLLPMLAVARDNVPLTTYLVKQVLQSREQRLEALRVFYPDAAEQDWELITAGQRVQVIKKGPRGGVLQFGTELVHAGDGSIAALLGASPGASTAVDVMLNLLRKCFPSRIEAWEPRLREVVPSYGRKLSEDEDLLSATVARTTEALQLAG
ncbi:malate dehydrogenase (quinone) [Kineococcus xinjiangensis]|uniref:Probable malate:quinone oxidoreductase n=1 Tax=Kineococcus xinjiangensis TaxID=512762 RepID=A0A2S6ISV9_9ACTN|nr:malate:quinone oxidoreductase [Kineococcus xinjiangensis]PPK97318.1 malate dehydrogenase (quinone) [Kineococcus xinjiangensis]